MEKEVKLKAVCKYNGHSFKTNKSVDLSLKFGYDELTNYIQAIQMLNENITMKVKVGDNQGKEIGTFMIKEIKIDGDGEGTIKLNSSIDFVDANAINSIVIGETFRVMLEAKIEVEETPTENEEAWDE